MPPKPLPTAPLSDWMQFLPQELYDKIHELTFTLEKAPILIDDSYKPPSTLQVSRATRQILEAAYYLNTFHCKNLQQLQQWAASLSLENKTTLKNAHLLSLASKKDIEKTEIYQLHERRGLMRSRETVMEYVRAVQWDANWAFFGETRPEGQYFDPVNYWLGPFKLFLKEEQVRAAVISHHKLITDVGYLAQRRSGEALSVKRETPGQQGARRRPISEAAQTEKRHDTTCWENHEETRVQTGS